jgi:hypothetical protein
MKATVGLLPPASGGSTPFPPRARFCLHARYTLHCPEV